jgi:LuxR family maltose regulon positive regulatory protein
LYSYLVFALASILPVERAVLEALVAPHASERGAMLAGMAWSVSRSPYPFVLAIDDAHLLKDSEGAEALKTMVEHLPEGSQLAFAGRSEPPLGLANLRSQGGVLDVGIDDLRLDMSEARELLAAEGIRPAKRDIVVLVDRTEGWPVGLYLASLAGRTGSPQPSGTRFAGDDRLLADYLRSEILDRIPPDEVRFLTRTSVLDELCGSLCDAVLEASGSAATLEEIERSNLLLVPLDRKRLWYRYHGLFQEMLRHELERLEPKELPDLARRASIWCEQEHLLDQAIHYAQVAGDAERVGGLLVRNAMRMYALGRAGALRGWFAWLEERGRAEGAIAVMGAWLHLLSGRAADAERWAVLAERGLHDEVLPDGSRLDGWLMTLRAVMSTDVEQMRADADGALQLLSPNSQMRPSAALLLGSAKLFMGEVDAADLILEDAVELGSSLGGRAAEALSLATRAVIAIRRGRWRDAEGLVEQSALVIAEHHLHSYASSALTHAVRARVAIHLGDAAAAREEVRAAESLRPLLTRALSFLTLETQLELARAYVALGDSRAATDALRDIEYLLRTGGDFGWLRSDAAELSARVEEVRAATPEVLGLTPAELRLLPLLATQLSFREIGEHLFVSVHTVRSQVVSIYRKLGVSSRTQAIERSRDLGLLPE